MVLLVALLRALLLFASAWLPALAWHPAPTPTVPLTPPQAATYTPPAAAVTQQALTYSSDVYLGATLRSALAQTPWPAALWGEVERIVYCESRGYTWAVSPGGHRGLMQVDPAWGVASDAVGQLALAWHVYQVQGWAAWSCA